MQKIRNFIRQYTEFSLIIVVALVGAALDVAGYDKLAHVVLAFGALAACVPVIKDMFETLREGSYGLDVLALTAIIVAVAMGEYWTAIVIVIMLTGGESLEDFAESRAQKELTSLMERAPKVAHKVRDAKNLTTEDVAVNSVKVGDLLLVKPGELVPVDIEVTDGSSDIDESSITGESLPVARAKGEVVLSGSVTIDGRLVGRAVHDSGNSQYQQIVKLVKDAAGSKSRFVRLADRYSIPFTIVSYAIAFTAWAVSGEASRFLEVIVVATPCPLLLGAPIAMISGMSRAAKVGIVMKNGSALERLASAKAIAFDKTGTLTAGEPKLSKIKLFGKLQEQRVLAYAAGIEHNSVHVLARAIVAAAHERGIRMYAMDGIREEAGKGLAATYNQKKVLAGKLAYLQAQGIAMPKDTASYIVDQTAVYLAIDGKLEAILLFEDAVRAESRATLARLQQLGIRHFMMLTGDNEKTAKKIAKQLGIGHIHANVLPKGKLQAIKDVPVRPCAMVGDGVNDAPVLAASDVGIAMGARGSTAASESADIVIMTDSLDKVSESVEIAKRTIFIGRQSILIGIGISVALMLIFATGRFKPVTGAALQEVVDVVVMLNALRAHGSLRQTLFNTVRRVRGK